MCRIVEDHIENFVSIYLYTNKDTNMRVQKYCHLDYLFFKMFSYTYHTYDDDDDDSEFMKNKKISSKFTGVQ